MEKVWSYYGNQYSVSDASQQVDTLPVGVYEFHVHPMRGPYLTKIQEKFEFSYKVYGIESSFINHVKRSWDHTGDNMGIILNGIKGTGKTVTAELICNELNLPVILIRTPDESLISFINDFQQDVIVFIDEYEKVYKEDDSLLSLMDGVFNSRHRKFFVLTTNDLHIDRNLIQRPGRIRYIKQFSDLTVDVITEIVDDTLVHKHLKEVTIDFISKLSIITVDIVKTVVEEVNIHEDDPNNFAEVLNIHANKSKMFNVYEIVDGNPQELHHCVEVYPDYISSYDLGKVSLTTPGDNIGKIIDVISENEYLVETSKWITVKDKDGDDEEEFITYRRVIKLEPATRTHLAFRNTSLVF